MKLACISIARKVRVRTREGLNPITQISRPVLHTGESSVFTQLYKEVDWEMHLPGLHAEPVVIHCHHECVDA